MRNEETFDRIAHAITCRPGKKLAEAAPAALGIPDDERALFQHQQYCAALEKCGVGVTVLAADRLFPARFLISDTAVVTERLAVMCNFSDNSPRQGEQKDIASALAGDRFLKFIVAPGRLDASDVLQLRDHFYITLSERTNQEGASQLAFFLKEYGYQVTMLDLGGENLHRLSAAAAYLGRDRVLIREELARHYAFLEYEKIVIPYHERGAANALMVNSTLVMPAGYTETSAELRALGVPVLEVNISEFEKMSGGLGCLSLRLPKIEQSGVITLPLRGQAKAVA